MWSPGIDTPAQAGNPWAPQRAPSDREAGEIKEVVDAVLFLADTTFTTGEILHVDGGAHAGKWQSGPALGLPVRAADQRIRIRSDDAKHDPVAIRSCRAGTWAGAGVKARDRTRPFCGRRAGHGVSRCVG